MEISNRKFRIEKKPPTQITRTISDTSFWLLETSEKKNQEKILKALFAIFFLKIFKGNKNMP